MTHLVLCSIANETLGVVKGNIRWCCAIALIVGNDFNLAVLPHTHTGVSGAQINANCRRLAHFSLNVVQRKSKRNSRESDLLAAAAAADQLNRSRSRRRYFNDAIRLAQLFWANSRERVRFSFFILYMYSSCTDIYIFNFHPAIILIFVFVCFTFWRFGRLYVNTYK